MVGYHPLDGHPPSQGQGWSPSIPGMVTALGWSPIIQSMVTHHPKLQTQRLQLNKEFDTSAAQLVSYFLGARAPL